MGEGEFMVIGYLYQCVCVVFFNSLLVHRGVVGCGKVEHEYALNLK